MDSVEKIDWETRGTGEVTTYEVGEDVVVVPLSKAIGKRSRHDLTEVELWRGRILEIRIPKPKSGSSNEKKQPKYAWVVLAWYYSPLTYNTMGAPQDLKGYRKNDFGTYELIYAPTHTDPVHIETLNGKEEIYQYGEGDHDADEIPTDAFYTRSEFHTDVNKWVEGPPPRECVCKQTYKLYEDEVMYYCPRSACRTWYHQSCLDKGNYRMRVPDISKLEDE
ncbi:hypothetical protein DACRYDRAFT_113979 [Dacryopinax primogenitus]|uniref:BAH domain-containing protein n=1 Tax=Dacryopinax primogenitus (strain DJM 731) TaxID=1858805 RepID=M5G779_DACPD|nr:uncharacterized protein DACRYDRAFT_113979 [Dacryopinax primogenitus]EJU04584.1 hypothetical protein DACRYDRAFT_113979 [Dacryopinax primogenitus]